MRFYFAGAYERRTELARYADQLEAAGLGAEVHSRWLTSDQSEADTGFSAGQLDDMAVVRAAWEYGLRDLVDLTGCDAIVSFTGQGERGGRHVEHGFAMDMLITEGRMRRLIVVGPREHVFHCHPQTEVFPDFARFLEAEIYIYLGRQG
jgi:hypothetical protein